MRHCYRSLFFGCLLLPALGLHLLAAGEPDCQTPLGMPCVTIQFRHTQWQLLEHGLSDIRHYTGVSTLAVRRDGSSATHSEQQFYVFLQGTTRRTFSSLYLAPDDQVVKLDHANKTISRRAPLIWHDRPYRRSQPDGRCETGIRHFGTHFRLAGSTELAGVRVVKWSGANGVGGIDEVYLAPSLDCVALKTYSVQRSRWHIPLYTNSMEAVAVKRGEPEASRFALPRDYRQVPDAEQEGLRKYLEYQRPPHQLR